MKVILRESIENLGKKGDIVNVAPGFGRNYLLPKKMALEVTSTNMKMIEMEQKALRKGLETEMRSVQALVDRLNQVTLRFTRKTGEKDTLFGSVNVADIKDALDKKGFEIEKRRILLSEPIKTLGEFKVAVKVFHDEQAEITLEVAPEAAPEAPVAAAVEELPEPEPAEATESEPETEPVEETPEPEAEESPVPAAEPDAAVETAEAPPDAVVDEETETKPE